MRFNPIMSDPGAQPAVTCTVTLAGSDGTGPWMFGVGLDVLLFGVLTVQIYIYYLAFPKDRGLLKLAVIWVYLAGVAQTGLAIVDLNAGLIHQQGGCQILETNYFWLTTIVFSEAAALTAQWLYTYRIYVISCKIWIVILVICLSLGQLGTSIVGCFCLSSIMNPFDASAQDGSRSVKIGGTPFCAQGFGWVWGPLSFLCDITITVSMSILLLQRRKGTLKKATHAQISRIVRIVVETGLATSIVVMVFTLAYNLPSTLPSGNVTPFIAWFTPGLIMGKMYSNSMLALLNSRLTIVGVRNTEDPFDNSEVRSEVLRTEVGRNQATSPVTRRRSTHGENTGSN